MRTKGPGIDNFFASSVVPPSGLMHTDGLGDDGGFVSKLVRTGGVGIYECSAYSVGPSSRLVHACGLGVDDGVVSKLVRTEGLGIGHRRLLRLLGRPSF